MDSGTIFALQLPELILYRCATQRDQCLRTNESRE